MICSGGVVGVPLRAVRPHSQADPLSSRQRSSGPQVVHGKRVRAGAHQKFKDQGTDVEGIVMHRTVHLRKVDSEFAGR